MRSLRSTNRPVAPERVVGVGFLQELLTQVIKRMQRLPGLRSSILFYFFKTQSILTNFEKGPQFKIIGQKRRTFLKNKGQI